MTKARITTTTGTRVITKNLVASGERLAIHLTDGEPNLHDLHDLKSL